LSGGRQMTALSFSVTHGKQDESFV
jgi:hypothetical protein